MSSERWHRTMFFRTHADRKYWLSREVRRREMYQGQDCVVEEDGSVWMLRSKWTEPYDCYWARVADRVVYEDRAPEKEDDR